MDLWRALKKSDEATLAYVSPDAHGVPQVTIDQTRFDYADVRIGSRFTGAFTVRNLGGGVLLGPLVSNKRWLSVQPAQLDASQTTQDITFTVSAKGLAYNARDVAQIEMQTTVGVEVVEVKVAIEAGIKAAARFRLMMALSATLAGALLGWGMANLAAFVPGRVSAAFLVGLAAVISLGVFWCVLARPRYIVITVLTWAAGLFGMVTVYRYYPPGVSIISWAILWGLAGYAGAPLLLRHVKSRRRLIPAAVALGLAAVTGALAYADIRATRNFLDNWDPSGVPPEVAGIIASFEPPQEAVAAMEPPVPIVDRTLMQCCDERALPALKNLTLLARNTSNSKSLGPIRKGSPIRVKAQEVHFLTYPRCEVKRSRIVDTAGVDTVHFAQKRPPSYGNRRLRAGEVYALLGENTQGQCRLWHAGATFWTSSCPERLSGSSKDRCSGGTNGSESTPGQFAGKVEFWEQIVTQRGTTGWVMTSK